MRKTHLVGGGRHAGLDAEAEHRAPIESVRPSALHFPFGCVWDVVSNGLGRQLPEARTLSMACLGRHGSWGNTVLQYAFLRAFCKVHGFQCETPNWIGRSLFQLSDGDISAVFPAVVGDGVSEIARVLGAFSPVDDHVLRASYLHAGRGQDYYRLNKTALETDGGYAWPFTHADLEGLYLVNARDLSPHKRFIRSLFKLKKPIHEKACHAVAALRRSAGTVIGVHIRRGDFQTAALRQHFELLTPIRSYLEWIEGIWKTLDRPRLVLCTDSPEQVLPHFSKYEPITSAGLGFDVGDIVGREERVLDRTGRGFCTDARFFPDWQLLSECDIVALSNSTFSFSASLLNERARLFVRPTFNDRSLQPFDPWESEPLMFLPQSSSLPALLASRLKWTLPEVSAWLWLRTVRRIVSTYPRMLKWRCYACYRCHGSGRLMRELLSPAFYWMARRRYSPPLGPVHR